MKVAVFVLWIEFFTVTVTLSRRPSTLVTTVPLNSGLYIFLQLLSDSLSLLRQIM